MKIIEFIKLVFKHKILLVAIPMLLATMVIIFTMKPKYEYYSQTILYTGLASGSSIEMDKSFNYFATNIAFDNLINIINSRETQEEVAIRLLSQHLLLGEADERYISKSSYERLMEIVPQEVIDLVAQSDEESMLKGERPEHVDHGLFPESINKERFESTVQKLTELMKSSNSNFVYELMNFDHEHYSIEAISKIKAIRISNSDLIKLSYQINDPGICQQTLAIFNEVCQRRYKGIKENNSDEVVNYFQNQLKIAELKLKNAEETLLEFNKSNSIINYYEQSKAVAIVKEEMAVDYNNKKAELASAVAATKKLEEKLDIQELVQAKSDEVIEKKKRLGELNFEIAMVESKGLDGRVNSPELLKLKNESAVLENEINNGINELYSFQNSIEGVPLDKTLPDWVDNVVKSEGLKAKLEVMDQRNEDFRKQYATYAPAGANLKKIEREIDVAEEGYLEILHGLNLAKLKSQDNELNAKLKTLDPPFYPLSPMPTKRKLLVIAALFIGFIITLSVILFMEFFDDSLRNLKKASKKIQLPALGLLPKILKNPGEIDQQLMLTQLMTHFLQNMNGSFRKNALDKKTRTILVLSHYNHEGKTVVSKNLAKELVKRGRRVLLIHPESNNELPTAKNRSAVISKILGYGDQRIGYDNAFLKGDLENINSELFKSHAYKNIKESIGNYKDFFDNSNLDADPAPEFVIIELRSLIYNSYPSELIANADLSVLVCRANRLWSDADELAKKNIVELSNNEVQFVLNGVDYDEVESVLGEIPKNRSTFRKGVKNILRLKFYSSKL